MKLTIANPDSRLAPSMPRVILTRAPDESKSWSGGLLAAGYEVVSLPLIHIQLAPDPIAIQAAAQQLNTYRAVMFVSAHAAAGFFKGAAQALGLIFQERQIRAWVTGPGTRQALLALGVDATCIDAPASDAPQLDSESLWQSAGHHLVAGDRVLIVRGTDEAPYVSFAGPSVGMGRNWLAERIRQAGCDVDFVVAYARLKPRFTPDEVRHVQQWAGDGTVWVLSSTQAVMNLQAALPDLVWTHAKALVTHPRIADAARQAGFVRIAQCKPVLEEMLSSLQSLH
jgi:uroporphyrinogen-III synthase